HPTSSSASSSSASHSPSQRPTTSASTATTTSCSGGASSCVLEGDGGKVIDAINAYRRTNGLPPVTGTTTPQAQTCSLNSGDGNCPTSYFWEPVTPQSGTAVVEKITSRSDGRSFLLDPSMKTMQIGWAYLGGQFSCTV